MSEAAEAAAAGAAARAKAGVDDWRILGSGLHARYRVASLAEAAAFAVEVAALAADAPRPPDVDVRAASVTVRFAEGDGEFFGPAEVAVAAAVQRAARGRGLAPDPGSLRSVQIAVAAAPGVEVRAFWQGILGYEPFGDSDARDPAGRTPPLWFHEIGYGRPGRGRTHVDVYLPADQAESVVAAAVAAGGRIAHGSNPPHWWTLASPDNHGVDVAPWPDHEWTPQER